MLAAALIPLFALLHTLGAILGTGTTTFAEFFYTKAASDGVIDHHERKYLRRMYRGLHVGMTLVVLSSIALMVLEYWVPNAKQEVLVPQFWAIQTLVLIVLLLGSMLSQKQAAWWFASAAILAGWWMILILDLGLLSSAGYLMILVLYVLVIFILAGVLGYVRMLMRPKNTSVVHPEN